MSKLLPCPFCGGEAEYYTYEQEHDLYDSNTLGFLETYETTEHCVGCEECLAMVGPFVTKKQAIKSWNTRAYEEKNDADVMENPTMYVLMTCWHRVIVPALIPAAIEACAYKSNVVFDVLPAGVSSSKEKLEKRAKELKEQFSSTFHSYEIVLVQEF